MVHASNADQAAFWNDQPGRNWVARQADLDTMIREVTDRLLAACAPEPGETVLDVGCGAGASTFALAEAVAPSGSAHGPRPLGPAHPARRGAAARARPSQRHLRDRRRPGPRLRARGLRPRRLALWRHVLRRPGGGVPQHRDRPARRRPDGLRRLGRPRGQSLVRAAAAGGGRPPRPRPADAAGGARPDGVPRHPASARPAAKRPGSTAAAARPWTSTCTIPAASRRRSISRVTSARSPACCATGAARPTTGRPSSRACAPSSSRSGAPTGSGSRRGSTCSRRRAPSDTPKR